jgi:hypothetical protein
VSDTRRAQQPVAGVPTGRLVTRGRPRPPARIPPRPSTDRDQPASPSELAALREQVLQFALRLPDVALGDSGLDAVAAGLFVTVSSDDGMRFELREFATLRKRPRWRLSVVVPVAAALELQRLGWGRPRPPDGPGALMLDLVRPRNEDDLATLQRVVAAAYRAATGDQGRSR